MYVWEFALDCLLVSTGGHLNPAKKSAHGIPTCTYIYSIAEIRLIQRILKKQAFTLKEGLALVDTSHVL